MGLWPTPPRFMGCLMEQTRFLSTILNIEYGILPIIKCIQRKGPIVSKKRTGQTIVLRCYEWDCDYINFNYLEYCPLYILIFYNINLFYWLRIRI